MCSSNNNSTTNNKFSQPISPRRRKRPQITWLLIGPLLGGLLTHLWDMVEINKHYSYNNASTSDAIYAAEVAPMLLRHKKMVSLDASWASDASDEDVAAGADGDLERYGGRESDDGGECVSMHPWQERSHPACNPAHEMDFFSKYRPDGDVAYVAHGGFNDLFRWREKFVDSASGGDKGATRFLGVKILKYEKDYSERKFEVVKQDAVTLERLAKSPHIYDVYGYCGFMYIVPYMTNGNLADKLSDWRHGEIEISSRERLQYAVDMARGLRDLHDIDGDGVPSATHGDLKEHQYLFRDDGRLVLGDFNKGYFLSKSATSGKPCTYRPNPGHNDKVFRSPEEYMGIQQTAAIDVYALGSIYYYLLTGERVWEGVRDKEYEETTRRWIIKGRKPKAYKKYFQSKDPVDVALKKAYEWCTEYDPEKRPTAIQISDYWEGVWDNLSKTS